MLKENQRINSLFSCCFCPVNIKPDSSNAKSFLSLIAQIAVLLSLSLKVSVIQHFAQLSSRSFLVPPEDVLLCLYMVKIQSHFSFLLAFQSF